MADIDPDSRIVGAAESVNVAGPFPSAVTPHRHHSSGQPQPNGSGAIVCGGLGICTGERLQRTVSACSSGFGSGPISPHRSIVVKSTAAAINHGRKEALHCLSHSSVGGFSGVMHKAFGLTGGKQGYMHDVHCLL